MMRTLLAALLLVLSCAPSRSAPPSWGAEVTRVDLPAAVVWVDGAGVTVVWVCE